MSEENLDIRKVVASYFGIIFRAIGYWKWGVAVCMTVMIAGTVYAATRRKIYTSSTRVRVTATNVQNPGDMMGEEDLGHQLKGRLKQFVGSRQFLQKIIDENGLYQEMKVSKSMTDTEVLEYMRGKMYTGVYHNDEFGFHFMDYDPDMAQTVTKSLAETFMAREKGTDISVYQSKLKAVVSQLGQLEGQLDQALVKQTRFKEVNAELIKQMRQRQIGVAPIALDPLGSAETTVTSLDSAQLRRLRNRLKTLEDTATRMRSKTSGAVGSNTALAARRAKLNDEVGRAKRHYDRLRQQYTEQWPDVRVAKAHLSQVQAQQRTVDSQYREAQRVSSTPSAELAGINVQIKQAREEVRRQARREAIERAGGGTTAPPATDPTKTAVAVAPGEDGPLSSVEAVEARLKRMDTEIRPLREQVQELHIQRLKLQFQTKQRERGGMEYEVIDRANRPTKPSGPNRKRYALAAAVGGFAAGCALMLLLGFIDARVYRPGDLARVEQIPLLVSVPDFEVDQSDVPGVGASPGEQGEVVDGTGRAVDG